MLRNKFSEIDEVLLKNHLVPRTKQKKAMYDSTNANLDYNAITYCSTNTSAVLEAGTIQQGINLLIHDCAVKDTLR